MRRDGRADIMKLIGAFRNRTGAYRNEQLKYYPLYFVRLIELFSVIVTKICSNTITSLRFSVSTTVVIVNFKIKVFYFGTINQNLWGLIYTCKNRAVNYFFVHSVAFPLYVTC